MGKRVTKIACAIFLMQPLQNEILINFITMNSYLNKL